MCHAMARGGKLSAPQSLLRQGLPRSGVVSSAGLDFVILFGLDFQLAISAILHRVGRGIAEVVLAAQFIGNLVEGLPHLVGFVAHGDYAAPPPLGKLAT